MNDFLAFLQVFLKVFSDITNKGDPKDLTSSFIFTPSIFVIGRYSVFNPNLLGIDDSSFRIAGRSYLIFDMIFILMIFRLPEVSNEIISLLATLLLVYSSPYIDICSNSSRSTIMSQEYRINILPTLNSLKDSTFFPRARFTRASGIFCPAPTER